MDYLILIDHITIIIEPIPILQNSLSGIYKAEMFGCQFKHLRNMNPYEQHIMSWWIYKLYASKIIYPWLLEYNYIPVPQSQFKYGADALLITPEITYTIQHKFATKLYNMNKIISILNEYKNTDIIQISYMNSSISYEMLHNIQEIIKTNPNYQNKILLTDVSTMNIPISNKYHHYYRELYASWHNEYIYKSLYNEAFKFKHTDISQIVNKNNIQINKFHEIYSTINEIEFKNTMKEIINIHE